MKPAHPIKLDVTEMHVLATLVEIQCSRPNDYPCSIDVLADACETPSSGVILSPLMRSEVHGAITGLIRANLVRVQQSGTEFQYSHTTRDTLHVGPAQLALLTVLMQRGAQSLDQVLTNSYRFFPFSSASHITEALRSLRENRPHPLVRIIQNEGSSQPLFWQSLCADAPAFPAPEENSGLAERSLGDLETQVSELESIVERLISMPGDNESR